MRKYILPVLFVIAAGLPLGEASAQDPGTGACVSSQAQLNGGSPPANPAKPISGSGCLTPALATIASRSQSGPPSPRPDFSTAISRARQSADTTCRQINTPMSVALPRFPNPVVRDVGHCQSSSISVPVSECFWQPKLNPGAPTSRWKCSIHVPWRTTQWTPLIQDNSTLPCLKQEWDTLKKYAPYRITIYPVRDIYVFMSRDGTVGTRPMPWGRCSTSLVS